MSSHFFIVGKRVSAFSSFARRRSGLRPSRMRRLPPMKPAIPVWTVTRALLRRQNPCSFVRTASPKTSWIRYRSVGIEALVAGGAVVSEADFAFVGEVIDAGWDFNRMVQAPIRSALKAVGPAGSVTGELFDAILADDTNAAP